MLMLCAGELVGARLALLRFSFTMDAGVVDAISSDGCRNGLARILYVFDRKCLSLSASSGRAGPASGKAVLGATDTAARRRSGSTLTPA